MAYRYGERKQIALLPASIEDYVGEDAVVRVYDAFVDALDFEELGILEDPAQVGNSAYDPRAMLKLLVYGYSYGVKSSRKLERETYYNLSFIWLMGGLKPDHKTIAEFRRRNKSALKQVIRECARICLRLEMIEGNMLFVDGSKWQANASLKSGWTKEKCQEVLARLDERIEQILLECDEIDEQEEGSGSLVEMEKELADQKRLKERVQAILWELQAEGKSTTNSTDPDCTRIRGRQGSHAGYNTQIVVDEKEGLIVHSDVVNQNTDLGQFAGQVEQAEETLGKACETACADAGFAEYEDLRRIEEQGIEVVVPSRRQAEGKPGKPFDKSEFMYDAERDAYRCPEGHWLPFRYEQDGKKKRYYATGRICRECAHFGVCTKNGRKGRHITRYVNEEFREKLTRRYESAKGRAIYGMRKEKVELPFGHIKRNLGAGHFLLRGLSGVRAEMSLLATCFNVARLITILGVTGLIAQLGG